MPSITDWLMVVITAVYVIATIFICRANIKSANATREQVAESKRQFEETRRLQIMPYLQFEWHDGSVNKYLRLVLVSGDLDGGQYVVKLTVKNAGLGTANNITFVWNWFNGKCERDDFPIKALKSGEAEHLEIIFALPQAQYEQTKASMMLNYEDLLGCRYSQIVEFTFEYTQRGLRFQEYTSHPPAKIE